MTDTEQHSDRPSPRLRRVLVEMAEERGVSFTPPATAAEARREFRRLKSIPRQSARERATDRRVVREEMDRSRPASSAAEWEIGGYGSNAHWR